MDTTVCLAQKDDNTIHLNSYHFFLRDFYIQSLIEKRFAIETAPERFFRGFRRVRYIDCSSILALSLLLVEELLPKRFQPSDRR